MAKNMAKKKSANEEIQTLTEELRETIGFIQGLEGAKGRRAIQGLADIAVRQMDALVVTNNALVALQAEVNELKRRVP